MTNYSLDSETAQSLIFVRSPQKEMNRAILPACIGVAVMTAGWLPDPSGWTGEPAKVQHLAAALRFWGMLSGAIGLFVAVYLPFRSIHRRSLRKIVFDHDKGAVQIFGSGQSSGFIPYYSIERFDIQLPDLAESGSKQQHFVFLLQKDGSVWELFETGSADKAGQWLQKLQQINLHRPCTAKLNADFPGALQQERQGSETLFSWSYPLPVFFIGMRIFVIALSVAYFAAVGYSLSLGKDRNSFIFNGPGLYLSIAAGVFAAVQLFEGIRKSSGYCNLKIGDTLFEYRETDKAGKERFSRRPLLSEVAGVRFDFLPAAGKKSVVIEGNGFSIELKTALLHPAECLQLKYWLQKQLRLEAGNSEKI